MSTTPKNAAKPPDLVKMNPKGFECEECQGEGRSPNPVTERMEMCLCCDGRGFELCCICGELATLKETAPNGKVSWFWCGYKCKDDDEAAAAANPDFTKDKP